ncbi:MAG: DUF2807 domain-containing protein [Bacteroidales bacterium]|nr:DUF2807 domain-containing protein [Bacteroidales bacterium]
MKKNYYLTSMLIGLTLLSFVNLYACDSFTSELQDKKENRDVSAFDAISLSISGNLYLTQGDKYELIIEGSESALENIETRVSGNRLVIKSKSWSGNWNGKVTIYVTTPKIESINVSGSGDVISQGKILTSGLDLVVSGSGSISFEKLAAENVESTITGSGNISLSGNGDSVEDLDVNITGSGDFNSTQLSAKEADVTITGSGKAKVFVTDKLDTRITGSGSVYYKGQPLINASSTGSGKTISL